ncbi:hypothetical protein DPMN_017804 [Dreissena polymorpha]|uniref:Uncharacterized protein n=1 Tax=Dreissena polymorpha TaxID=45954 RepID=A0A9D4S5T1_DREPO|nr:hypothetical protein DPMN_017804 [Dreissena polymorpha]
MLNTSGMNWESRGRTENDGPGTGNNWDDTRKNWDGTVAPTGPYGPRQSYSRAQVFAGGAQVEP